MALVCGVVLGASAAIGVALSWTEPYWVPEPILILGLYIIIGRRDRIRGKTIGTTLGVIGAALVSFLDSPTWALALLATVAVALAFTQTKRYWLMYGLYTFALILALAAPGQVATEAEHRGFEILVGTGLLLVGLAVMHKLAGWLVKNDPQPELAPNR